MKTRIIIIFLAAMSFLSAQRGFSQTEVPVVSFDTFEPWLHKETDSIYVINFWATWCAPCVREIPAFEALHENYAENKVKVLLVSLDFPNHLDSRLLPFIKERNMQSQVILLHEPNANRWIPLVSEEWSGAIPATIIYGRGFRRFYEQEFTYEQLEEIIQPLIY
jgi:thiol-disulfide isomerase/thioredoxin